MCELMGMCFAKPVVASVSIQAFSQRAQDNADGWGLAWYPDRSLAMVKQPVRWSLQHTQFLEHYPGLLSSIYVAHVRQRTTGSTPTHADTHPFVRELNGREFCFAHNGTLTGEFWNRPLGRFRPIGSTDSEYLFCLLLAELEDFTHLAAELAETHPFETVSDGPVPTEEKRWRWLHKLLLHLNDFGRLNCLLTDGDRLLVYRDKHGWKGLYYRTVFVHSDKDHSFGDDTVAVNLQSQLVNQGIVVATNPLGIGDWQQFLDGEMKVLRAGSIEVSLRARLEAPNGPAPAVANPTADSREPTEAAV